MTSTGGGDGDGFTVSGVTGGGGGFWGGGVKGGAEGGVAGPLDSVPTTGAEVTGTPSFVLAEAASGSCVEIVDCSCKAEARVPSTVTMTASTIVLPPESANSICAADIWSTFANVCLMVSWSTSLIDRSKTNFRVTKLLLDALEKERLHVPHLSGQWTPLSNSQIRSEKPMS